MSMQDEIAKSRLRECRQLLEAHRDEFEDFIACVGENLGGTPHEDAAMLEELAKEAGERSDAIRALEDEIESIADEYGIR